MCLLSFRISHFDGFSLFCTDNILKHKLVIYFSVILLHANQSVSVTSGEKQLVQNLQGAVHHIYQCKDILSYVNTSNHIEP